MAKSTSSDLSSDLLMCKICQLPYNEPKRLPCLHTFCKSCLLYHAKVNAVSAHDDAVLCLFCPLCRQLCELPIRSGVESLPDHHLLRSLVEAIESRAARYCDACSSSGAMTSSQEQQQQQQDEQKKTKEKKWTKRARRSSHCCVKCEEFLCDSCARSHRLQRTTAEHNVVSVAAMKELCQVMAVEQLQKPNVVAKLINKFALTPPVSDRAGSRVPAAGRRGRLGGGGSSTTAALELQGLALTKADELVLANAGDDSILLYDVEGRLIRRIDQRHLLQTKLQQDEDNHDDGARAADAVDNKLACVAVTAEGYIAVAMHDGIKTGSSKGARAAARRVAVVESLAGRVVSECDVKPASKAELSPWPYGIATTENGHVVVSDAANHCVYVFDTDFRHVRRFGRRGSRNRQFKSPRHLAITPNNDILVSDYGNHCVKVFSLGGDFRLKIGGIGRDPGRFLHPAGVCTDKFGNVFVADRDNHRVQMFDKSGKYIAAVLQDTCSASARHDVRPIDVTVTSQSRLVVLLTGVEGVDFVEVHIYQLRCTLPPPEVRSVQQILSTIRALRRSDPTPPAPIGSACDDDDDDDDDCRGSKKVRFKLSESQQPRRTSRTGATATSGDNDGRGTDSRVCVII